MDWTGYMRELKDDIRSLNRAIPDATRAFGTLSKAVKDGEALPATTKEYIALAIAVVQGCTPCIAWHAEILARMKAPRAEVAEALAMAIQMGGGPALMKAAEALAAFDEYAAAQESAAAG
ncbi:MAG: carboxymuconolactone decarboxylase family protein [Alphaproteobacteria bacterium]|nr:MAG: carboxymuconolactone decarboxylase family protein [Alphaproteobacteria bacterium]